MTNLSCGTSLKENPRDSSSNKVSGWEASQVLYDPV